MYSYFSFSHNRYKKARRVELVFGSTESLFSRVIQLHFRTRVHRVWALLLLVFIEVGIPAGAYFRLDLGRNFLFRCLHLHGRSELVFGQRQPILKREGWSCGRTKKDLQELNGPVSVSKSTYGVSTYKQTTPRYAKPTTIYSACYNIPYFHPAKYKLICH